MSKIMHVSNSPVDLLKVGLVSVPSAGLISESDIFCSKKKGRKLAFGNNLRTTGVDLN
jgi:hypothetical protein